MNYITLNVYVNIIIIVIFLFYEIKEFKTFKKWKEFRWKNTNLRLLHISKLQSKKTDEKLLTMTMSLYSILCCIIHGAKCYDVCSEYNFGISISFAKKFLGLYDFASY